MKRANILQISLGIILILAIVIPLAILLPKEEVNLDQPILIYSDEDFLKYDFAGDGTESDPYLINGRTIINDNIGSIHQYGIWVENTTKYFSIQNCIIKNYDVGIVIGYVRNDTAKILNNYIEEADYAAIHCGLVNGILIENNEVNGGSRYGIYLIRCSDSLLRNNSIYNYGVGIALLDTDYITLQRNNCSFNSHCGITSMMCNYINIENNIVSMNQADYTSSAGLELLLSNFLSVINNSITENSSNGIRAHKTCFSLFDSNNISYNQIPSISHFGDGIFMEYSDNNTIQYNLFKENGAYGLNLTKSNNNTIHHNAFIRNDQKIINQAFEENCTTNMWYDFSTFEGNYWQGWNTSLAYSIEGGFSEDLYPLEENPVNLILSLYWLSLTFNYRNT